MVHQTRRGKAIQRLEKAKKEDHQALTAYYQLYQDLLQIQEETELGISTSLEMVDEAIFSERMRAGLVQLSFDHLCIDANSFRVVVQKILILLLAHQDENVDIILPDEEALITKARERFLHPPTTGESDLLELAIDQASMPYLEHTASQVMSHMDGSIWQKGYCPACGGESNFAYLKADDGSRRLVCSRCRYEWRYKRTGCPFCDNSDPKTLRYYPAGEKKAYRLYVCDSCSRYLKAIDQRIAGSSIDLIAEPILTWSLDKAAREKGYH